MKKASKAFSIGDKMHNLERIHSKLIHFYNQHKEDPLKDFDSKLSHAVLELGNTVSCFSNNIRSKSVADYVGAIEQVLYSLKESLEDLFDSLCYLASRFALFKKNFNAEFSHINKGCEFHYQEVCFDLYFIESTYRERKQH